MISVDEEMVEGYSSIFIARTAFTQVGRGKGGYTKKNICSIFPYVLHEFYTIWVRKYDMVEV